MARRIGKHWWIYEIVQFATYFWLPVVLVALWWFISSDSQSFFMPPLSEIVQTLLNDIGNGELLEAAAFSMRNVGTGLSAAIVLGVSFGLLIGYNSVLRSAVWPLIAFLRAIPGVAIIPIVLVAFGVGPGPQIFVIALGCVWPILLNTIDGVRGIQSSITDTARAYRLPRALFIRQVLLPAATPQIMAGIRISLAVSLTIMVVSEFSAGNQGLGVYISSGVQSFAPSQVWAGTVFIGLIGYLTNVAFVLIERRILAWYFEIPRRTATKITSIAGAENERA
ncbi:ABC transporter permease [uncultured Devosia sp.]|uniref:ABC transporter permease n=1 Tax=uncultured Devosia sp. TaxID=211434 RepID=UPI00260F6D4F|nr:ABC transporter permease [uncultured Devosia sp.]